MTVNTRSTSRRAANLTGVRCSSVGGRRGHRLGVLLVARAHPAVLQNARRIVPARSYHQMLAVRRYRLFREAVGCHRRASHEGRRFGRSTRDHLASATAAPESQTGKCRVRHASATAFSVASICAAESGSRWSARSEARTNDLDADEQRNTIGEEGRAAIVRHAGSALAYT
jgi:hypothetical protein